MNTIWKSRFPFADGFKADVPVGSRFVRARVGSHGVDVWYLCDQTKPFKTVHIHICGTGHSVPPPPARHFDTVFDDPFVWHFFVSGEDQ